MRIKFLTIAIFAIPCLVVLLKSPIIPTDNNELVGNLRVLGSILFGLFLVAGGVTIQMVFNMKPASEDVGTLIFVIGYGILATIAIAKMIILTTP